ncbi:ATP-binding protein [Nocardioides sp. AE5]|uniref:ATP-binding protein n=1 Tax=Nocardioides sp. AE5 TaxID=2962573 RepID=UPI00288263BC|nr:ATP-binding protein [Nocardioides sp. AE5]MDT0200375.1 ATP-binding protein [Nocardioides sp. AE5]
MSQVSTLSLVQRMRRIGADLAEVEVKAAARGMPKTVVETLSAFANGSGGTLILGLSEEHGFTPVDGFDPLKIRDSLAGLAADSMEPPVRADIEIEEFEGAFVVRMDVPELDPRDKPAHIRTRGAYAGSFIRGGDGDRRLTSYEVTQLLSNRSQPEHDRELVLKASPEDLDAALVADFLARARKRTPRAFKNLDDEDALVRLGVLGRDGDDLHPTLAGLLALGSFPQQFFPQLYLAVVALPGLTMGETTSDGRRFLDNHTLDGPIPEAVVAAIAAVERNMSRAAIIKGAGREDRYDYPLEVIRELIVNGLMHRDYSPESRGTHVQVEVYPDRLVVKNPGGLFGPVNADVLGTSEQQSASRNELLAKLLTDTPLPETLETVCEKRGSGLPTVVDALRKAGMSPPNFDVDPGQMIVTIPRHALLSVDVLDWMASLGHDDLTDAHRLALAIMHNSGRVTNQMLQAWGVDARVAGAALRDLVDRGIASASGGRRYASYRLEVNVEDEPPTAGSESPGPEVRANHGVESDLDAIKQAIRAGRATAKALEDQLGIPYATLMRRLKVLRDRGEVEQTEPSRSRRQTYRIVSKGDS